MAIAFDASSNGTPGTGNMSWTHTPVGTPRGIAVMICQDSGTGDEITSVTYGGVACTQATGSPLGGGAGLEDGLVAIWILGSSVPTGAQTVAVNVDGTASAKAAVCISMTANFDVLQADTCSYMDSGNTSFPTCGSQTVHIQRGECLVLGVLHSGEDAITSVAADSGYSEVAEYDFGTRVGSWIRKTTNYPAGGGSTGNLAAWTQSSDDALAICIMLTESAFLPVLGQATETDATFAAAVKKAKAVGQATESDSGLAAGKAKVKAVGQTAESDSGLAATAVKSVTLGIATESDSGLAVSKAKALAVGLATETDAALATGKAKVKAVGLATESDSGLSAGKAKVKAVGQASETDAGQALGKAKSKAVGQATESDSGLPATPVQSGGGQVIALGIAVESDSGLAVGKAKVKAVGQAVETDLAMALYSGGIVLGRMLTPPLPMWPVGIGAVPLPAGKFRVTWGYDPHGQGAWPTDFQVFESPVWDVPLVDSETGLNVVAFDVRRKQFSFTTAAYAGGSSHAFGVRARNSAGVAERNRNYTATVTAKTVAPSSAKILQTQAAR